MPQSHLDQVGAGAEHRETLRNRNYSSYLVAKGVGTWGIFRMSVQGQDLFLQSAEFQVHGDGAILDRGIDARDDGGDDATASVDGSFLADGNIFGEGFGHLNFGFALAGIGKGS